MKKLYFFSWQQCSSSFTAGMHCHWAMTGGLICLKARIERFKVMSKLKQEFSLLVVMFRR